MRRCISRIFLLTVLLAAVSCVSDHQMKKVDPYYIFHNNTSNVWLIRHLYKDGKDYSPMTMGFKDIITFHKTRNCYIQRMGTFGDEPGRKATFLIDGDANTVTFDFPKESWKFDMKFLSHEKIILVPISGRMKYTMELVPVPEP